MIIADSTILKDTKNKLQNTWKIKINKKIKPVTGKIFFSNTPVGTFESENIIPEKQKLIKYVEYKSVTAIATLKKNIFFNFTPDRISIFWIPLSLCFTNKI
jgi:hypothetical protein